MLICATETCNASVTLDLGFLMALVLDEGQRRSNGKRNA